MFVVCRKTWLCFVPVFVWLSAVNAQHIYLGKGRWVKDPEKVKAFVHKEIEKRISYGMLLTKKNALVWNARSAVEFDHAGFDTLSEYNVEELVGKYLLQEARKNGNRHGKITTWFCGERGIWRGKVVDGSYNGILMVVPVIPRRFCGCASKRKTVGQSESTSISESVVCPTIHQFVKLNYVLRNVANYNYNQFGQFPSTVIDRHHLWTISVLIKGSEFPSRIDLLRFDLESMKCDTISVNLPADQHFLISKEFTTDQILLSVNDTSVAIAFGNRLIYANLEPKVCRLKNTRLIYLPGEPIEMKLTGPDKLAYFSYFLCNQKGITGIGDSEIRIFNLRDEHNWDTIKVPFTVREVLQLVPNHYVSFGNRLFFAADAFSYRILIYDSLLHIVDSINRNIDWKTIPPKMLDAFNKERDSIRASGGKVLSCSTVDITIGPSYFHKWDAVLGIYALNDTTLFVAYQKKTNCNQAIIRDYFDENEGYIPVFYDIWQRKSSTGKFELIQQDLEEYFPPFSAVCTKANYPFNSTGSLLGMSMSDSSVAVWHIESAPFGYKYSKLKKDLISKVIKMAGEEENYDKPSLYIYRISGIVPSSKKEDLKVPTH